MRVAGGMEESSMELLLVWGLDRLLLIVEKFATKTENAVRENCLPGERCSNARQIVFAIKLDK